MTNDKTLLTAEEMAGIRERDEVARDHTGLQLTPTEMDRAALIRHVDALEEQMAERDEKLRQARIVLRAVDAKDFSGIECDDVELDGKRMNWFDARDTILDGENT